MHFNIISKAKLYVNPLQNLWYTISTLYSQIVDKLSNTQMTGSKEVVPLTYMLDSRDLF
jgi:hypothetical protein